MKKTTKPLRATRTPKVTRKDNPTASTAGRRAKPKTAYELLERVCEHIKEEPRRYYQNQWAVIGPEAIVAKFGEANDPVPACGTVACRAGWIVALNDGPSRLRVCSQYQHWESASIKGRASAILGMDAGARGLGDLFGGDWDHGGHGSTSHVRRGIAGLRAFMKKNATHLKARLLKDVPSV